MEGPVRFRCPPEFEAVAPSPPPGLQGGALGRPSTELWLIRTPADFCPESLEGFSVLLDGHGQLQPPGDGRLYGLQGGPGGAGSTLLLAPDTAAGPLACAPPFRGCLTITESFGPPPVTSPLPPKRKKKKKKATKELPEPPEVSPALGAAGGECSPGPPPDSGVIPETPEVPRKKKKKKKKKKHKREQPE